MNITNVIVLNVNFNTTKVAHLLINYYLEHIAIELHTENKQGVKVGLGPNDHLKWLKIVRTALGSKNAEIYFLFQVSLTCRLDEWCDPQCQSSHTSQAGSGTGSRGSVWIQGMDNWEHATELSHICTA